MLSAVLTSALDGSEWLPSFSGRVECWKRASGAYLRGISVGLGAGLDIVPKRRIPAFIGNETQSSTHVLPELRLISALYKRYS
jgi:hypothetical protein